MGNVSLLLLPHNLKGASAVLVYGAIESPLAQPRALLGGHFIASLIGVSITKLFSLLHSEQKFDELRWLAGSLSTATAIVAMQITETTHPPAGASALLAAVSPEITELGWLVIPCSRRLTRAKPLVQVLPPDHIAFVDPHACRRLARQQHPAALSAILVYTQSTPEETHRASVRNTPGRGVCHHRPDGQRCSNEITPMRATPVSFAPITRTTASPRENIRRIKLNSNQDIN